MSEYITTYTGKHFNPTQPNPDLISIQDIAHALSLICRGNGHVQTFWSVGQHCICCAKEAAARGLSNRMVLACLLHDASECYMSDVPTPFKKELPEYQEQEEHLLRMIYEKFLGSTLTSGEQAQLKEIDHAMLLYDLENLLGEVQYGEIPDLQIDLDYTVRPFAEVEDEYLTLFAKYSGTVAPKTVYLEDIADAFEECMDGWAQFLDTRTGEIVALAEDPYIACEEDQELWEEIDETEDYVRLQNQYELHEKRIMEKFAYEIGNQRVSEVLFDALRRRHPYRCFKDKINDLGISQIYYDYRNRTYINIAEEWCRNHHVPYRRKED